MSKFHYVSLALNEHTQPILAGPFRTSDEAMNVLNFMVENQFPAAKFLGSDWAGKPLFVTESEHLMGGVLNCDLIKEEKVDYHFIRFPVEGKFTPQDHSLVILK